MNILLKAIPIPLSGLMLGVVALAKLFFQIGLDVVANILFAIGVLFFILLTMKACLTLNDVLKDLRNPIIASVAPTFTMGTMIISSILMTYHRLANVSIFLWFIAVIVQFTLIGFFIIHHIVKTNVTIQSVFPSWFVTFVGIGMIPVTAPTFVEPFTIGILYIAITMFLVLLPIIFIRVFVVRDLPIPTKPLITILTAPASLCLTAYLTVMESPNIIVVTGLLIVAQLLYFIVLYKLQTFIKLPFYPSFGAFTFPLVVSATALYSASKVVFVGALWMKIILYFEIIVAAGVVCYVVTVYLKYIFIQIFHQKSTIKHS